MDERILSLYETGATFRESLFSDLDDGAAWFNMDEFARFHDIDGVKILSVFTTDTRSQEVAVRVSGNENSQGVYNSRGVLYIRSQEIEGVNAEQPLRLDGRLYTIVEARKIQDAIWRIVLEANES